MTAMKTKISDPGGNRVARRRKLFGLAFMAPPVILFAVFAVAEGIELASGWWGHVVQFAAAAGLAVVAWIRPRIGGPLLIVAGIALLLLLALQGAGDGGLNWPAIVIVFVPLVVAGVFFTLAGTTRATSRH
jgi:hypothetical protein